MLNALDQAHSVELIGEILDTPEFKAVVTARPEYFSQGGLAEIIDGEFRVLGKAIRVVNSEGDETINLIRKTTFGKFDNTMFEPFTHALSSMEGAGLRPMEVITEIKGPALLVIPIAIFT